MTRTYGKICSKLGKGLGGYSVCHVVMVLHVRILGQRRGGPCLPWMHTLSIFVSLTRLHGKKSEKEEKRCAETEASVSRARGRGQSGVRAGKAPPCLRCGGLAPTTNQPTTNAIFEMRKMEALLISAWRKNWFYRNKTMCVMWKCGVLGRSCFFECPNPASK